MVRESDRRRSRASIATSGRESRAGTSRSASAGTTNAPGGARTWRRSQICTDRGRSGRSPVVAKHKAPPQVAANRLLGRDLEVTLAPVVDEHLVRIEREEHASVLPQPDRPDRPPLAVRQLARAPPGPPRSARSGSTTCRSKHAAEYRDARLPVRSERHARPRPTRQSRLCSTVAQAHHSENRSRSIPSAARPDRSGAGPGSDRADVSRDEEQNTSLFAAVVEQPDVRIEAAHSAAPARTRGGHPIAPAAAHPVVAGTHTSLT